MKRCRCHAVVPLEECRRNERCGGAHGNNPATFADFLKRHREKVMFRWRFFMRTQQDI